MSAKVIPFNKKHQDAWAEYVAAQERAKETGDLKDGIEAGKAWGRWLALFAPVGAA